MRVGIGEKPLGLSGTYTMAQIDALLAAVGGGGGGGLQTVDLSAYAKTEYVDGKLATVYTKAEVDAALANVATGGTVDLAAYATTAQLTEATDEIKEAATAAFQERYTKTESDGLFMRKDDAIAPPSLDGYATEQYVDESVGKVAADVAALQQGVTDANAGVQSVADSITFVAGELSTQLTAKIDTKADKATTYTKAEVDEALAGAVSGQLTPAQIEEIISQVGPVDLTDYAKISDNTQNLLAKVVTAQGYGFGDKNEPPAALTYTDTGEGYGERLVLAAGSSIEYVVMKSDFDPLKSRMDALESKAAPTIDAYTKTQADSKFLTLVDIDQFAYRADVYTQKQCDDRFMRIDQAFSKTDFDNQMALSLYSRKQVDDKLTAISPLGANSVDDPALADFKKSVLDAVKMMMAGGTKQPPPDIDWTWMVRMDGAKESVSTEIQARMIGGFIELKGTLSFGAGSGAWVPLRLPPQFPLADLEASYPLAMRLVGTAVTYGYCTVSNKSRDISCSPGAKSSEATFSGIRFKAAY